MACFDQAPYAHGVGDRAELIDERNRVSGIERDLTADELEESMAYAIEQTQDTARAMYCWAVRLDDQLKDKADGYTLGELEDFIAWAKETWKL